MQLQQPPKNVLLRAASPPSSSPASALQRRRAAGSARPARGCLSAAASSSAWQGELVTLFGWEAAERAAGEASGSGSDSRPPPTVLLDGANLLWAYGHAVSKRFGCKIYPSAAGLLLALDYEVRLRGATRGVRSLVCCHLACCSAAALARSHAPACRLGARRACA